MGNVSSSVRRGVTRCTEQLGQVWTSIITALVYLVTLAYCITSTVLLSVMETSTWVKALGFSSVLVAGTSHFTIYFMGMGFVDRFVMYPERPKWIYLSVDVAQAIALGMVTASYSLAPSNRNWILVANGVCILVQVVSLFKLYRITRDVWSGKRHDMYGYEIEAAPALRNSNF